MMKFYQIIDIIFCIDSINLKKLTYWQHFEHMEIAEPDFRINSIRVTTLNCSVKFSNICPCEHLMFYEDALMCMDTSYQSAYIYYEQNPLVCEAFIAYLFYTHAIQQKTLWLHCSIIDIIGRGVIFLGPSGIGKTTQAECWQKYRDATIINGDVGLVQKTDEGFRAWGTPWHGSSPYCVNASVPVKALVILKQSKENRLRRLEGFEKLAEVSGNVFYPTWLEDGVSLCTDVLGELLNHVPVYRLENRADEESVEILEKELNLL